MPSFRAVGAGLVHLPSGMLQVSVDYFVVGEEQESKVCSHVYIVTDRAALLGKVTAQLDLLKQTQDDRARELNIVGQELGNI